MSAPRPYPGGPDTALRCAPGVKIETLLGPNPLWASNGVAFGPDGRLWIAQFLGGLVSALDLDTGHLEAVIGPNGPLTAPDDLAFDTDGTMYIVDLPPGLVWRRQPDGEMSVVADGITAPDGIACHEGRLFVNELHPHGRLLEIDLGGGPPRVLATGLALGNAMQVGPDRRLYYPHLLGGEVWRVPIDGGRPQRLLAGLDSPVAVRFDPRGRLLVLSNNERGTVTTLDLGTGTRQDHNTGIAGADNLAVLADGRMFVSSSFRGGITELRPDGTSRPVLPQGLNGPYGIAATPARHLLIADHFAVVDRAPDGRLTHLGDPGRTIPSGVRGATLHAGELHVTTDTGEIHAGDPATGMRRRATGLRGPTGLVSAPDGGLLVADTADGRIVHIDDRDQVGIAADGLGRPVDVTCDEHGDTWVTDAGRGQIVRLRDHAVVAAGLQGPEGLTALGGALWCLEARARQLRRVDPQQRTSTVVTSGLPLAALPTTVPTRDAGPGALAQRPAPFAALERVGDTLVLGATGHGGLLRLAVFQLLGGYYSRHRPHSTINYEPRKNPETNSPSSS